MLGIISWILTPAVLCQGFNGADLRNVCTEAGMAAIRAERDYVIQEDFMKVRFHHFSLFLSLYLYLTIIELAWCSPCLPFHVITISGSAQAERGQEARVQRALQRRLRQGVKGDELIQRPSDCSGNPVSPSRAVELSS